MKALTIFLFVLCTGAFCQGQNFVYKAKNPAFGGDTFNYQWLLSSANAQNQFKAKGNALGGRGSSLDNFTDSINRQLMSQLSRNLFGDTFKDGELAPGTYMFGSLYLEIIETSQGLLISILNTDTGEQSEIIIPNN